VVVVGSVMVAVWVVVDVVVAVTGTVVVTV